MVETLGEAWDAGWNIKVACAWGRREGLKSVRDCGQKLDVDLETLIWTRGRACTLAALQDRMRCPKCGSLRVRIIFIPPENRNFVRASLRPKG